MQDASRFATLALIRFLNTQIMIARVHAQDAPGQFFATILANGNTFVRGRTAQTRVFTALGRRRTVA
jgi:hypothetical protein